MADKADEDTLFSASIDDKGIVRFFDVLDDNLDDVEKSQAFDKLQAKINKFGRASEKSGKKGKVAMSALATGAGAALAAITALVAAITAGTVALGSFAAGGVRLADQLESAQIVFTNIFGGNEDAALAFMDEMNKKALEFGVSAQSLTGFSKALLPDTASIDEFDRLVKAAVTLDKSDPDKTIDDVRIAFEAAISGDFKPLIDRFDLPRIVAADAKKATAEGATAIGGILESLETQFERTGDNIESQAGTLSSMMTKTTSILQTLQAQLGEPIQESLKPVLETIVNFLENNQDDLKLFAQALGDIIADLVQLAGVNIKGFTEGFDASKLLDFIDGVGDGVKIGKEFVKILFQWIKTVGDLFLAMNPFVAISGALGDKLRDLVKGAGGFRGIMLKVLDVMARSKAGLVLMLNVIAPLTSALGGLGKAFAALLVGDFAGAASAAKEAMSELKDGVLDTEGAIKKANASYAESRKSIDAMTASLDDNNAKLDERREKLGESNKAQLEFIQATLAAKDALKKLEIEQENIIAADKALIKVKTQLSKSLISLEIAASRKRFDLEKRESRRREDLAKTDADARLSISQSAAEARQIVLGNVDAERLAQEKALSLDSQQVEEDKKNALIDLEKSYREELKAIQRGFLRSATEAQISNDVSAFLSAKRSRDDSLKDAKRNRGDFESDIRGSAEKQQKDIKKARDASRVGLEKSLKEQLAAVDENQRLQTKVFEEGIVEREKAHKLTLKRESEDHALNLKRQEEDLIRSLQDQLSSLKEKHGEYIDVTAEGLLAQTKEFMDTYGPAGNVDGIMDKFFDKQQERLAELSESRKKVTEDIASAKEKLAGLKGKGSGSASRSFGGRLGGEKEDVGQRLTLTPAEEAAQRRKQEFLDRLARLEKEGVRGQIGQSGLVSQILSDASNKLSPASFRNQSNSSSTNRSDTLTVNMEGVEPYLQRVATQAALEIFRNITAGRGVQA